MTTIDSSSLSFIQKLGELLKHGPVQLQLREEGTEVVRPVGVWARLWPWNRASHSQCYSKLALLVDRIVAQLPRMNIVEAMKDPILRVARDLTNRADDENITSPELSALVKRVVAARLSLTVEEIDANEGLYEFAEKFHLDAMLKKYGHQLQVDRVTKQISIMRQDQYVPWDRVYSEMQTWKFKEESPKAPSVYGLHGVQNRDYYEWTKLEPAFKDDPAKWGYRYVKEICVCYNPKTLLVGNHSWVRFYTPTGDIYSFGLYRPEKSEEAWGGFFASLILPFRVKPGYLQQPDVSEFWPFQVFTIDQEMSEQEFLEKKALVEQDKKNNATNFQLFGDNCIIYGKKVTGIEMPSGEPVYHLIVPEWIKQTLYELVEDLPLIIRWPIVKIFQVVAAILLNVAQIFAGASVIDSKISSQQRPFINRHIRNPFDLFSYGKTIVHHPLTTAFKVRKQVVEWRTQELEKLLATETDVEVLKKKFWSIRLGLPPWFSQA